MLRSMARNNHYQKNINSSPTDTRVKAIPNKFQQDFFIELDKLILKFILKNT